MLGICADTSISVLRNTKDRLQSGITLKIKNYTADHFLVRDMNVRDCYTIYSQKHTKLLSSYCGPFVTPCHTLYDVPIATITLEASFLQNSFSAAKLLST